MQLCLEVQALSKVANALEEVGIPCGVCSWFKAGEETLASDPEVTEMKKVVLFNYRSEWASHIFKFHMKPEVSIF